jgi:cytochrome c-type protein NapB
MSLFIKFLTVAGLAATLAFSSLALADEPDYAADARKTGGDPPTVPHQIADDATSESCNVCHRTGIKDAPVTSHPERMGCTQCHVPGEVKKPGKKAKSAK